MRQNVANCGTAVAPAADSFSIATEEPRSTHGRPTNHAQSTDVVVEDC